MSVYLARIRDYMKIGYSADPFVRVASLTHGSMFKPDDIAYGDSVDLLGWVPGDRKTETAMHMRFGHLHVVGEWFWDHDDFYSVLRDNEYGVPLDDLPPLAVMYMREHPNRTRADVVEAVERYSAIELADPNSDMSIAAELVGSTDEWIAQSKRELAERRAADRAYWRSLRGVAA